MRRALRWAGNGLATLSLVLCVATCALWWRSYRVCDLWYHNHVGTERPSPAGPVPLRDIDILTVESERGGLFLQWSRLAHAPLNQVVCTPGSFHGTREPRGYPEVDRLGTVPHDQVGLDAGASFRGFAVGCRQDPEERPGDDFETHRGVVFPHWALVAVAGLSPSVRVFSWWRRRRAGAARAGGFAVVQGDAGGPGGAGRIPPRG